MKLIKNTRIITPFIEIKDGFLVIKDKIIHFVGDNQKDDKEFKFFKKNAKECIDFKNKIAVPGFIDIHTHGNLGRDYSNTPDLLPEDCMFRATKGATGFLPTIGSMVYMDQFLDSVKKLVKLMDGGVKGSQPLGINLEGPYLRPDVGAQSSEFCFWDIDMDFIKKVKRMMGDKFKVTTIAPELGNAMEAISYLRENDVVPAIGHTLADENLLDLAIRSGANMVTHILNTTYQPEQNIKGIVVSGVNEYLMIRDDVMAEVICDINGVHVNPTMMKILLRCKGIDNLILITDSYMTPGVDQDGVFKMQDGREFIVKDGVNVQVKTGHVSGSAMTSNLCVKSMLKHTGVPLKDGVLMASYNPAKILNLDHRKGSLEVGKDADIVAIDEDVNVFATMVEGGIVYSTL